jgi:cell division protein FtsB
MRTMSTEDEIEKLRAENQRLRKENSDLRAVVEDLLRFQAGEHPETWEGILERAKQLARQAVED